MTENITLRQQDAKKTRTTSNGRFRDDGNANDEEDI